MRNPIRAVGPLLLAVTITTSCATNTYYSACEPWESLVCDPIGPTDSSDVEAVVLLVGDAGQINEDSKRVLATMRTDVERWTARGTATTVLFLGDDVYETGLQDPSSSERQDGIRRLEAQIDVIRGEEAGGIFLPGNHDWGDGEGATGVARLGNLARYLERSIPNVKLVPEAGCPGPVIEDLSTHAGDRALRLIVLDTHWWLQAGQGIVGSPPCPSVDKDRVINDLGRGIRDAPPNVPIIVAAHHPLRSGGSHGGNSSFGRAIPHRAGMLVQDLNSGPYREMIARFDSVFAVSKRPIIYAAGHEHTLQVISDTTGPQPIHHLVSGAGSKSSNVMAIPGTQLSARLPGYMRLEFLRGNHVRLHVVAGCPIEYKAQHPACAARAGGPFRTIYSEVLR
jgi:Calcineurin-like phosphoesterase